MRISDEDREALYDDAHYDNARIDLSEKLAGQFDYLIVRRQRPSSPQDMAQPVGMSSCRGCDPAVEVDFKRDSSNVELRGLHDAQLNIVLTLVASWREAAVTRSQ